MRFNNKFHIYYKLRSTVDNLIKYWTINKKILLEIE